ncbi:MAG: sulfatase-like hydrolase/transferase [Draconibacterium sp.]|nr:sulfatase-like hydrolase/transferase [Draconibacterium sp.]
MDQLASDGIIFTNGYASAYVCAPTRAGLLTGRYQQRFGFYRASDSRQGMPKDEITLADILKKEGYKTGVFGKWHLGLTEPYYPTSRGFDEFYGFLGHGAHDYFDLTCKDKPDDFHQCIFRNDQKIDDTGYLTDNLGREACAFIKKNAQAKQPFYCYLPFNAVHWPLQAPEEDIKKFNTGDKNRDVYLAMLHRMDLAIGKVIQTLKDEGVYENTIVVFLSDNGGAKKVVANNLPLRDFKQSVYEGGLRVPFIISWPKKFIHSVCEEPVISFDIMPTICAALKIDLPSDRIYDGKNILPAIENTLEGPLHDILFWDGNDNRWAVREGDFKLVSVNDKLELYNLNEDIGEQHDLTVKYPEKVTFLKNKYEKWRNEMATPMGGSKNK